MNDSLWKSPMGGFNNPCAGSSEKGSGDGEGSAHRNLQTDSFPAVCAYIKMKLLLLIGTRTQVLSHSDCFPNRPILKTWHPATEPHSPAMTE